jgi:hypothetical protein
MTWAASSKTRRKKAGTKTAGGFGEGKNSCTMKFTKRILVGKNMFVVESKKAIIGGNYSQLVYVENDPSQSADTAIDDTYNAKCVRTFYRGTENGHMDFESFMSELLQDVMRCLRELLQNVNDEIVDENGEIEPSKLRFTIMPDTGGFSVIHTDSSGGFVYSGTGTGNQFKALMGNFSPESIRNVYATQISIVPIWVQRCIPEINLLVSKLDVTEALLQKNIHKFLLPNTAGLWFPLLWSETQEHKATSWCPSSSGFSVYVVNMPLEVIIPEALKEKFPVAINVDEYHDFGVERQRHCHVQDLEDVVTKFLPHVRPKDMKAMIDFLFSDTLNVHIRVIREAHKNLSEYTYKEDTSSPEGALDEDYTFSLDQALESKFRDDEMVDKPLLESLCKMVIKDRPYDDQWENEHLNPQMTTNPVIQLFAKLLWSKMTTQFQGSMFGNQKHKKELQCVYVPEFLYLWLEIAALILDNTAEKQRLLASRFDGLLVPVHEAPSNLPDPFDKVEEFAINVSNRAKMLWEKLPRATQERLELYDGSLHYNILRMIDAPGEIVNARRKHGSINHTKPIGMHNRELQSPLAIFLGYWDHDGKYIPPSESLAYQLNRINYRRAVAAITERLVRNFCGWGPEIFLLRLENWVDVKSSGHFPSGNINPRNVINTDDSLLFKICEEGDDITHIASSTGQSKNAFETLWRVGEGEDMPPAVIGTCTRCMYSRPATTHWRVPFMSRSIPPTASLTMDVEGPGEVRLTSPMLPSCMKGYVVYTEDDYTLDSAEVFASPEGIHLVIPSGKHKLTLGLYGTLLPRVLPSNVFCLPPSVAYEAQILADKPLSENQDWCVERVEKFIKNHGPSMNLDDCYVYLAGLHYPGHRTGHCVLMVDKGSEWFLVDLGPRASESDLLSNTFNNLTAMENSFLSMVQNTPPEDVPSEMRAKAQMIRGGMLQIT